MNAEPEHLLWQVIIVVLFGGIYVFLGEVHASASDRTDVLILLSVMVLSAVVWQAVGLGVARVHMLIAGIDLDRLAARQARK